MLFHGWDSHHPQMAVVYGIGVRRLYILYHFMSIELGSVWQALT